MSKRLSVEDVKLIKELLAERQEDKEKAAHYRELAQVYHQRGLNLQLKNIAEKFGASVHTIKAIQQGDNWSHV